MRLAAVIAALLAWPLVASAQPGLKAKDGIVEAHALLDDWQAQEGAAMVQRLYDADPDNPEIVRLMGRVKFEQSQYEAAIRLYDKADAMLGGQPDHPRIKYMRHVAQNALDITKSYVEKKGKRFIIRYPPGKDAVLVPYAMDAMEAAYDAFAKAFDFEPPTPVVIEVYPGAEELAGATTLTVQEIETSGTIAVCKFNRLMITSPKALGRGYTWLDTLSHEYVHLVISKMSRNNLPIWLQEAFAKYMETAWRGEPGQALRPSSANLLAEALAKDELITFEQMSPSMAKLPSQEATALAFAEVFTVMNYIHSLGGNAMANKIIHLMARGVGDRDAVSQAVGTSFASFEKNWLRWLRNQKLPTVPGAKIHQLSFKKSGNTDEGAEEDGLGKLENDKARRFLRLGEILRARGRIKASVFEYEKAVAATEERGEPNPHIMTKLGVAYLQAQQSEKAETVLQDVLKIEPSSITTHTQLGRLYFQREDWGNAEHHYQMALRVNPFNPEIHLALHKIYEGTQPALAEREAQMARILLDPDNHQERPMDRLIAGSEDTGLVTLYSLPWAEVIVDEKRTGLTTPLIDEEMPAGERQVELINEAKGLRRKLKLVVPAGGSVREQVDMTR